MSAPRRHRPKQDWLQRHVNDPFVRQAQRDGYRSRAAYKLLEMDRRARLLRPGAAVVDLGAAPGSWSQVAAARVGASGWVLAVDLLEMEPLAGVAFLQGDFLRPEVAAALREGLPRRGADLVLSDMAPNLSGIRDRDQARALELALAAVDFAVQVLDPRGALLVKAFQGSDLKELEGALRAAFVAVRSLKPEASRSESSELYLLARGVQGGN